MSTKSPRRSATQWRELVEQQAGSGQTIDTFCTVQKINRNTFIYHRQKYRGANQKSEPVGFVALTAGPAEKLEGRIYVRSDRFELEFPADYPAQQLSQLLNALSC